jgi:N-acetyl-alpha-D-glucosaminyl L-malate synthase BshA
VLHVFAEVRKKIPSKLLLVGDGPERASMEMLSRELEIAQDVRFLGKLDAVEEVLSIADLFLMPSESESFGLAALEAMACEVPVVSSNIGGIPELNTHGFSGFTAEVGDIKAMVQHSLHILDDANLPTFRANALKRAQDFELSKILPMYEQLYEKVLIAK